MPYERYENYCLFPSHYRPRQQRRSISMSSPEQGDVVYKYSCRCLNVTIDTHMSSTEPPAQDYERVFVGEDGIHIVCRSDLSSIASNLIYNADTPLSHFEKQKPCPGVQVTKQVDSAPRTILSRLQDPHISCAP